MIYEQRQVYFFLPYVYTFCCFIYGLIKTSNMRLKGSGERGHFCLALALSRKVLNSSPSSKIVAVDTF
jgi:hypothetical protein